MKDNAPEKLLEVIILKRHDQTWNLLGIAYLILESKSFLSR